MRFGELEEFETSLLDADKAGITFPPVFERNFNVASTIKKLH
jgi:hypothetical protein